MKDHSPTVKEIEDESFSHAKNMVVEVDRSNELTVNRIITCEDLFAELYAKEGFTFDVLDFHSQLWEGGPAYWEDHAYFMYDFQYKRY